MDLKILMTCYWYTQCITDMLKGIQYLNRLYFCHIFKLQYHLHLDCHNSKLSLCDPAVCVKLAFPLKKIIEVTSASISLEYLFIRICY